MRHICHTYIAVILQYNGGKSQFYAEYSQFLDGQWLFVSEKSVVFLEFQAYFTVFL